jgi:hypothetical protein
MLQDFDLIGMQEHAMIVLPIKMLKRVQFAKFNEAMIFICLPTIYVFIANQMDHSIFMLSVGVSKVNIQLKKQVFGTIVRMCVMRVLPSTIHCLALSAKYYERFIIFKYLNHYRFAIFAKLENLLHLIRCDGARWENMK